MAYNKKTHLRANIEAIKLAFQLEREHRTATNAEVEVLRNYSGFGGLKCILNPANSLMDIATWSKSEVELFPLVSELHGIIRENSQSEQEYKRYFGSLKNSILTAFYTPPEVVGRFGDTELLLSQKKYSVCREAPPIVSSTHRQVWASLPRRSRPKRLLISRRICLLARY